MTRCSLISDSDESQTDNVVKVPTASDIRNEVWVMGNSTKAVFWNAYAMVYDAIWRNAAGTRRINMMLESIADSASPSTCVDLGCGTGLSSLPLHEYGWHVIGVDKSSTMLSRAMHKGRIDEMLSTDASSTPLPAGIARLVVLANILQTCPNPSAVIREAMRLRAPDGVIVAIWPNVSTTLSDIWRDDTVNGRGLVSSTLAACGRLVIGLIGNSLNLRPHDGQTIITGLQQTTRHMTLHCTVHALGPLSICCLIEAT